MKRPVPIYDFTAFGKAIKEVRTKRGESRKNVSDDMDISPARKTPTPVTKRRLQRNKQRFFHPNQYIF